MQIQIKSGYEVRAMNKWSKMTAVDENGVEYPVQMVKFDEPSEYGISGGRISKLYIVDWDNSVLANFDRAWNKKPVGEIANAIVNAIISEYN